MMSGSCLSSGETLICVVDNMREVEGELVHALKGRKLRAALKS